MEGMNESPAFTLLSLLPFTHTQCKFGYYSGENTFISTTISGYTIFPDAQHRKLDDTFQSVSENLSNITKEGEHIYIISKA